MSVIINWNKQRHSNQPAEQENSNVLEHKWKNVFRLAEGAEQELEFMFHRSFEDVAHDYTDFRPELIKESLLMILIDKGCPHSGIMDVAEDRSKYDDDDNLIKDTSLMDAHDSKRSHYYQHFNAFLADDPVDSVPNKRRAEPAAPSTFVSLHRKKSPLQIRTQKLLDDYEHYMQPSICVVQYLEFMDLFPGQICNHRDNRASPFIAIIDFVLHDVKNSIWNDWRDVFRTILIEMLKTNPPFTQEDLPVKYTDPVRCERKHISTSVDCKDYVWKLLNLGDDYEDVVIAMIDVCAEEVKFDFWEKACENGMTIRVFEKLKENEVKNMTPRVMEMLLYNLQKTTTEVAEKMFEFTRSTHGDAATFWMLCHFDYASIFNCLDGHVIVHKMMKEFPSALHWGAGHVLYHAIRCHKGDKMTEDSILEMLDANEEGVYGRTTGPSTLLYEACKTPKSFRLIQTLSSLFPTATLLANEAIDHPCRLVDATEKYWTGSKGAGGIREWTTTNYVMNVTHIAAGVMIEWALGPMCNNVDAAGNAWCPNQDLVRLQIIDWMQWMLEKSMREGPGRSMHDELEQFLNGLQKAQNKLDFACYKTAEEVSQLKSIIRLITYYIDFRSLDKLMEPLVNKRANHVHFSVLCTDTKLRCVLDGMARMKCLKEESTVEQFIDVAMYLTNYDDFDPMYLLMREFNGCVIKLKK